jgi:DNA gyrase subunit A
MATNIPPHNLGEVIDGCVALIDNPAIDLDAAHGQIIPGPDFPTGGIVLGRIRYPSAYETGRGSIVMRGKVDVEERPAIASAHRHRDALPGQQGVMIEKMADLVRDKRIEGISDIRDESDREGYRVVDRVEARRRTPMSC